MRLSTEELEKKEQAGESPRVTHFAKVLNSDLLDERFLQTLPAEIRKRYSHLPIFAAQISEAYRIRNRYDAIISWSEKLGIPFALLLKITGKRLPHIGLFSWISGAKKAYLLKSTQSHFDRIVLMSSAQRDYAVNGIGIPSGKIVLMRWPVDQLFWKSDPAETDMICTVGREMRDYDTFLKALEGLSIRCHIAAGGRAGDKKKDEWKKVLENGHTFPDTITTGNVPYDQLRKLYARSRFVVIPLLPTDTDNGATTILEAMAMGKAVICTKTSGQRDIIKDGQNGIFVPQGDVRALKHAIEYLWNNPQIAESMGKEGRKLIEEHHTLDGFLDNMRRLVEEVVADFQTEHKIGR